MWACGMCGAAAAREFINRVQKLRKKVGLKITDSIEIFFDSPEPAPLLAALSSNRDMVLSVLRVAPLPAQYKPTHAVDLGTDDCVINDVAVKVMVTRPTVSVDSEACVAAAGGNQDLGRGLEGFVASLDYDKLSAGNGNKKLSLNLNGKELTAELGKQYFLTATERVRALGLAEFAWL